MGDFGLIFIFANHPAGPRFSKMRVFGCYFWEVIQPNRLSYESEIFTGAKHHVYASGILGYKRYLNFFSKNDFLVIFIKKCELFWYYGS